MTSTNGVRGGGVVVKVGGRAQSDPALAPALIALWRRTGARAPLCVVHGGGDEVSALQRAAGVEPVFVGGRRVTSVDDIDRLRMALSGVANKRLVSALSTAARTGGANAPSAIGLSGEDGRLIVADLLDDGSIGAVGAVSSVNAPLISLLSTLGYLPVVAPVAAASDAARSRWTARGLGAAPFALNVNGDDAAGAVAAAIGASELLYVSDVSCVRIDGMPVSELTSEAALAAIGRGEITGGMIAKVESALAALDRGVSRVRIGSTGMLDGSEPGTTLVAGAAFGAVVGTAPDADRRSSAAEVLT